MYQPQEQQNSIELINKILRDNRTLPLDKLTEQLQHKLAELEQVEGKQKQELQEIQLKINTQKTLQQKLQDSFQQRVVNNQEQLQILTEQLVKIQTTSEQQIQANTESQNLEKLLEARFLLQIFNEFLICRLVGGVYQQIEFAVNDKQDFNLFNNISPDSKEIQQQMNKNCFLYNIYQPQAVYVNDLQYHQQQSIIYANQQQSNNANSTNKSIIQRIISSPLEDSPLVPPAFKYLLNNPYRRFQALYILFQLNNQFNQIKNISVPAERLFTECPPKYSLLKIPCVQQAVYQTALQPQALLQLHNQTIDFIKLLFTEISGLDDCVGVAPLSMLNDRLIQFQQFFTELLGRQQEIRLQEYKQLAFKYLISLDINDNQVTIDLNNSISSVFDINQQINTNVQQPLMKDTLMKQQQFNSCRFLNKYYRNNEIFQLFKYLQLKTFNFAAAKRVCRCIQAIGGDALNFRHLVFEVIGIQIIDLHKYLLINVEEQDLVNFENIENIDIALKKLVYLGEYFQKVSQVIVNMKKLLQLLMDDYQETFNRIIKKLTIYIHQQVTDQLLEVGDIASVYVKQKRFLLLVPCIKILFQNYFVKINQNDSSMAALTTIQQEAKYFGFPTYGSLNIQLTSIVSKTSNKLDEISCYVEQPLILNKYLQQIKLQQQKKHQITDSSEACLVDVNNDLLYALDEFTATQSISYQTLFELSEAQIKQIDQFYFEDYYQKYFAKNLKQNEIKGLDVSKLQLREQIQRFLKNLQLCVNQTFVNMQSLQQFKEKQVQAQQQLQLQQQDQKKKKLQTEINAKIELRILNEKFTIDNVTVEQQNIFCNQNAKILNDIKEQINGFIQQINSQNKQTIQQQPFLKYQQRYHQFNNALLLQNHIARSLLPPLPFNLLFQSNQLQYQIIEQLNQIGNKGIIYIIQNNQYFKLQQFQMQHVNCIMKSYQENVEIINEMLKQNALIQQKQPFTQIQSIAGANQLFNNNSNQLISNQQFQQNINNSTKQIVTQTEDAIFEKLFYSQRMVQQLFSQQYKLEEMMLQIKNSSYLQIDNLFLALKMVIPEGQQQIYHNLNEKSNQNQQQSLKPQQSQSQLLYSTKIFDDLQPIFTYYKQSIDKYLILTQNNKNLTNLLSQALFFVSKKYYQGLVFRLNDCQNLLQKLIQQICGDYYVNNSNTQQLQNQDFMERTSIDLAELKLQQNDDLINQQQNYEQTKEKSLPLFLTFKYQFSVYQQTDQKQADKILQQYIQIISLAYPEQKQAFKQQKDCFGLFSILNMNESGQPQGFTSTSKKYNNNQSLFKLQQQHKDNTDFNLKNSNILTLLLDGQTQQLVNTSDTYISSNKQPNQPNPIVPIFDFLLQLQQCVVNNIQQSQQYLTSSIFNYLQSNLEVYQQIQQLQQNYNLYASRFLSCVFQLIVEIQLAAFRQIFCLQNLNGSNNDFQQKNHFKFEHFDFAQTNYDEIPGKPAVAKFITESYRNFSRLFNGKIPRATYLRIIAQIVQNFPFIYAAHISRYSLKHLREEAIGAKSELDYYTKFFEEFIQQNIQPVNDQETLVLQQTKEIFIYLDVLKQTLFGKIDEGYQQLVNQKWLKLVKLTALRAKTQFLDFLEDPLLESTPLNKNTIQELLQYLQ